MNGARNAPANAPQDTPINCAINVTLELYCINASTTDIAMNTTINTLMMNTCRFSSMSFITCPFKRSSVNVELEASTSDDSVDIDAESTRITTTPSRISGSPDNMMGITES